MSAWNDYLTAAQRLDESRRGAAAVVANQAAAVQAARTELGSVRHRIVLQRNRLAAIVTRLGMAMPDATPRPDELRTARASLPAVDPSVAVAALRDSRARLDTADAILSTIDNPRVQAGLLGRWPAPARNGLVYVGFAVLAVLVPLITFRVSDSEYVLLPTIGCAALLPILGYILAMLSTGLVYRPAPGVRVERSPVLGAALTVGTVVFLYGVYLALVVTRAV